MEELLVVIKAPTWSADESFDIMNESEEVSKGGVDAC
jgi:hypothetical protein